MKKRLYKLLGLAILFAALFFTQNVFPNAAQPELLLLFINVAPFIIGTIFLAIAVWAIVKWFRIKRTNKDT